MILQEGAKNERRKTKNKNGKKMRKKNEKMKMKNGEAVKTRRTDVYHVYHVCFSTHPKGLAEHLTCNGLKEWYKSHKERILVMLTSKERK